MDIKRLGENSVRCVLTEEEIHGMGFDIDEIITDSSKTQEFMQEVLELVEEEENIRFEKISPMVQAELLPDHQLAVTFGSDSEAGIRSIVDTIRQMMNGISMEKKAAEQKEDATLDAGDEEYEERKVCSLCFEDLKETMLFCKGSVGLKLPESMLYKLKEEYELILDFSAFTEDEIKSYAFVTGEFGKKYEFGEARVAYILEHGSKLIAEDAIMTLASL